MLGTGLIRGEATMSQNDRRTRRHIQEFQCHVGRRALVIPLPSGPGEDQAVVGRNFFVDATKVMHLARGVMHVDGEGAAGLHIQFHPRRCTALWPPPLGQCLYGLWPLECRGRGHFLFHTAGAVRAGSVYFLPEGRKFQQENARRNLTADVDVLPDDSTLALLDTIEQEAVFPAEDEGLAAWSLRMGPNMAFTGPDPMSGGGQYYVVMNGSLNHGGKTYEKWSCLFVEPPEDGLDIQSGSRGLEVLILQYPYWEKGTILVGNALLHAEDRVD